MGDTLRAIFDQPLPVLPQYEPWFDLVHLEPESFDRFWKPHRNIIVLELADRVDTQTPEVKIFRKNTPVNSCMSSAKPAMRQAWQQLWMRVAQSC